MANRSMFSSDIVSTDHLKILISKGYIIPFEDKIKVVYDKE